jgi:hypothetical protein
MLHAFIILVLDFGNLCSLIQTAALLRAPYKEPQVPT